MLIDVSYTVPVYARVNLDTGEVERVITYDEGIAPAFPGSEYVQHPLTKLSRAVWALQVQQDAPYERPTLAQAKRAIRIAEREDWPAWESGF